MDSQQWRSLYQTMLYLLPQGIRQYQSTIPYFTGYSYGTLYDWDQYFEAIGLFYAGFPTDYVRNAVRIFLERQEADGFIARSIPENGGPTYYKHRTQFKPFLIQQVLLCKQVDHSLKWLTSDLYERLRKYLVYWLVNRDVRGAGLSVWHDAGHTGMDNHYERAGDWGQEEHFCEGVDLNAYLVREARAMALLAQLLGKAEDQAYFDQMAQKRTQAIQRDLWDDKEGIYYDFHARQSRPIRVKYVGTFAALWAGVATAEQAGRLVREHLLNEKEFWRPYPLPGLAASEPGYAEGFLEGHSTACCSFRAHTWLPTNYYTMQGLRNYGYEEETRLLVERTERMFLRGPFSEYYTSENGIGTGLKPFWGWSCLALFMNMELALGTDPTRLDPNNRAFPTMRQWLLGSERQ